MRSLPQPTTDDLAALKKLNLSRSKNARAVTPRAADIQLRYATYVLTQGDPWQIAVDPSFTPLRTALQDLYSHPPKALAHVSTLRGAISGACPVCGRDGLGTLDHYLPKAEYSEFSFFSLNLVPACDRCNNARRNLVRGANQGERPLHPYFDAFAADRIMTIDAQPDWRAPRLTPVPFGLHGPERATVQWHIDNVIRPAGIDPYLRNMWGTLVNSTDLLGTVPSGAAVAQSLFRQMRIEAATGNSPNAWRSCFYHGIATNNDALDYLASLI